MIDKIFEIGLKNFLSFYPQDFVSIREALDGKLNIRLSDGYSHLLKKEEVEKISHYIPLYLWSLVRIPFVILKTMEPGEYIVNGSEWEIKALSILLNKDVSKGLRTGDIEKLIKEYKSLIIITLSPINLANEDEENGYY
ncbi:DUF61 family protein [Sulfurisphaera ohwakuensis]|uniref:DUF61 family protein n=1 Tax=Sulfurisphaera ohwakuensis TaxID=69656 RepID=A0A650CGN5_SULOH|nr:DUF61 family protein [Sulfurisphaera ohwakuensis]MBB5252542.1 hypothetical protein [Sulfurisphaera ohwakuensis]QGR17014.1 DUF61 family protein [Sulfurisphaera ohwakuensis]